MRVSWRRLRINKSRSHGEENEPKTARSTFFVNPSGDPISHKEWPKKSFYPVLRKLCIRLRDFYSTRHTFITEMIRRGSNLKAIAEYCGTSVAMIERSHGNLFPKGIEGGVKHLAADEPEAKVVTFAATSAPRGTGTGVNPALLHAIQKWSHGESNPGLRRERPPS